MSVNEGSFQSKAFGLVVMPKHYFHRALHLAIHAYQQEPDEGVENSFSAPGPGGYKTQSSLSSCF